MEKGLTAEQVHLIAVRISGARMNFNFCIRHTYTHTAYYCLVGGDAMCRRRGLKKVNEEKKK